MEKFGKRWGENPSKKRVGGQILGLTSPPKNWKKKKPKIKFWKNIN